MEPLNKGLVLVYREAGDQVFLSIWDLGKREGVLY